MAAGGGVARLEDAVLREYEHVAHGGLREAHGNGDYEQRLAMSAAVGADTDLDSDADTDMIACTHVHTPSLAHSQILECMIDDDCLPQTLSPQTAETHQLRQTQCTEVARVREARNLETALLEAEIAQVALLQV